MSYVYSLYLKWHAFRNLVGHPLSDREIAEDVFGGENAASNFAKLLKGGYGLAKETADALADVMNKRIAVARAGQRPAEPVRSEHLYASVSSFIQAVIKAGDITNKDALDRTRRGLLDRLAPTYPLPDGMTLVIEQFASTRAFASAVPSGSTPIFVAGQDRGQLKFRGARETPACAYVLFARDPGLTGQYPWDLSWSETVFWLPSPFVAPKEGDALMLMSRPEHLQAKPGRFTATAVLVWDASVLSRLDPRGEATSPMAFDEEQTCQFINEVHTLATGRSRRDLPAISVSTAEYEVRVP